MNDVRDDVGAAAFNPMDDEKLNELAKDVMRLKAENKELSARIGRIESQMIALNQMIEEHYMH